MSNITTPNHAQNISHYVAGLARQPNAVDQLTLSLLAMPDEWRKLAMHRLHMRKTALLDVMSDAELEAIGTGQVDLWSIVQTVATAQANNDPLDDPEVDASPDPSILQTIELIAQRKLGHTTQPRHRDMLDFFEIHVGQAQEALLAAFMAGMQLKDA
jgi:hypothetical protein